MRVVVLGLGRMEPVAWICAATFASLSVGSGVLALDRYPVRQGYFDWVALSVLAVASMGVAVLAGFAAMQVGPLLILNEGGKAWLIPSGLRRVKRSRSVDLKNGARLVVEDTSDPRRSKISLRIGDERIALERCHGLDRRFCDAVDWGRQWDALDDRRDAGDPSRTEAP